MLDREETERLFKQQAERMHKLAVTLLHDEEEARDAVSEIFERLTNGDIRLPMEKPESYLLVCLRNLCLDQIRKLTLRERMERHLTMDSPSLIPVETEEELLNEMMSYAEEMMTPQTWRVFQLRFDEGLSYRHISEQLGISQVSGRNTHSIVHRSLTHSSPSTSRRSVTTSISFTTSWKTSPSVKQSRKGAPCLMPCERSAASIL